MEHLEDRRRLGQAPEPVGAECAQVDADREIVADQIGGRVREPDLPAAAGRAEAGAAV